MVSLAHFEGELGEIIFGSSNFVDQSIERVPLHIFEMHNACVELVIVGASAQEVALFATEDRDFTGE